MYSLQSCNNPACRIDWEKPRSGQQSRLLATRCTDKGRMLTFRRPKAESTLTRPLSRPGQESDSLASFVENCDKLFTIQVWHSPKCLLPEHCAGKDLLSHSRAVHSSKLANQKRRRTNFDCNSQAVVLQATTFFRKDDCHDWRSQFLLITTAMPLLGFVHCNLTRVSVTQLSDVKGCYKSVASFDDIPAERLVTSFLEPYLHHHSVPAKLTDTFAV